MFGRSRRSRLRWATGPVVLLLASVAGCADPFAGLTGVAVTVRPCASAPAGPVESVELTLVPSGGEPETQAFSAGGRNLPLRFTGTIPEALAGPLEVSVLALGREAEIGRASVVVQLAAGVIEPVVVQVCDAPADGGPDGGDGGDDGGPGPDGKPQVLEGEDEGVPVACGAEGQVRCGMDCVDRSSDPNHCGRCRRSCLGSTCTEGRCQPIELIGGQAEPVAVTASPSRTCWANRGAGETSGEVRCLARDAEADAVEVLAADRPAPEAVALAEPFVFWVESGEAGSQDGAVLALDLIRDLPLVELATGQSRPRALALTGDEVYWLNGGEAPAVRHVSLSGRGERLVADGSETGTDPAAVLIDGDYVYWVAEAAGTSAGSLRRSLRSGEGPVEVLAEQLARPRALAILAGHVYVAIWGTGPDTDDGAILRVPQEGGRPEPLVEGQSHPVALVTGQDLLIWATEGPPSAECSCSPDGELWTVGIAGGEPELLARDQVNLSAVALADDGALFFSARGREPGRGAIYRQPR